MLLMPMRRMIATGLMLVATAVLSACGQKGPLFIPSTPAAQQRATLPQTVWGATAAPVRPASAAVAPMPLQLPDDLDD
jgi:predicted small lipoprotein YifL